jgi:integral membrane sensor domain MASE1
MLIVAPIILVWAHAAAVRTVLAPRRAVEALVLLGALVVTTYLALGPGHDSIVQPGPYAVFPLLLWAALRFGPAGAATCSLIVAGVATWNAALGLGPFTSASTNQTAIQVYSFLGVASLTSLIAAGVLEERKATERQLLECKA